MLPVVIAAAAAAAGFGIYELWWKKKHPVLQSLRTTSPTGQPVQVIVPVAGQAPPISGVSATPLHPQNTGTGASYAPAPVVAVSKPGQLVLAPTVITPTGAASLAVTTNQDVQNALNTLGYASPALVIDGILGAKSQAAVRAFQSAQGLTVDGIAGPQTKGALQSALASLAGTNSHVGAAASTLAASGDPPFGVEVGGMWTSGVSFGRGHHKHKKHKKHKKQQAQDGNGNGNGGDGGDQDNPTDGSGDGDGDSSDGTDSVDGPSFGLGTVIPSTYKPSSLEDDGSGDSEFGSSRVRGLYAGGEMRGRASPDPMAAYERHRREAFAQVRQEEGPICRVATIADIQNALNVLGASPVLVQTGIVDAYTLAAIKAFQISHGLVADGVPGNKTKWAICAALNPDLLSAVPEEVDDSNGNVSGEMKNRSVGFG